MALKFMKLNNATPGNVLHSTCLWMVEPDSGFWRNSVNCLSGRGCGSKNSRRISIPNGDIIGNDSIHGEPFCPVVFSPARWEKGGCQSMTERENGLQFGIYGTLERPESSRKLENVDRGTRSAAMCVTSGRRRCSLYSPIRWSVVPSTIRTLFLTHIRSYKTAADF